MWFSKFWGVRGLEYFLEFQGVTPPWKFQALQVVITLQNLGQDVRAYRILCRVLLFIHQSDPNTPGAPDVLLG